MIDISYYCRLLDKCLLVEVNCSYMLHSSVCIKWCTYWLIVSHINIVLLCIKIFLISFQSFYLRFLRFLDGLSFGWSCIYHAWLWKKTVIAFVPVLGLQFSMFISCRYSENKIHMDTNQTIVDIKDGLCGRLLSNVC